MKQAERYLITAALPYANGPLHIGHIAGAYLPADMYVRYLKLKQRDAVFVCGSDEHGAAITIQAKKEGKSPQEIIDQYHAINQSTFEQFGIEFDIYHRTSDPLHHQTAQDFFMTLYQQGTFIEKESEQFYDEEYNQFLADRYIIGTCPKCGNESAYGDQCEKCGTSLSPTDLIEPRSTLSGNKPVLRKTTHWFLPLNKDEQWLKEWIEQGTIEGKQQHDPKMWKRNVLGQCKSWLNDGLQPRAITRDLDWGVDVPQEVNGSEGKKLYVWLDAPIGYISATKQLEKEGKIEDWKTYWQDEGTELIHFIGKDNIVFHCIIFPSLLKAHGQYVLPKNVPANEFLNLEQAKISTSKNWAVWLHEYVAAYPNKIDELRYVLMANAPETKDAEFTWKDYQDRINNELVATLGNYVNRIIVLVNKYFDGNLCLVDSSSSLLIQSIAGGQEEISQLIERFRFREALDRLFDLVRKGNKELTDSEPWKQIKVDKEAVHKDLTQHIHFMAHLAILMKPFLPETSQKIAMILGIKDDQLVWSNLERASVNYFPERHKIGKPTLLFEKIEDDFVQNEMEKLKNMSNTEPAESPVEKNAVKPIVEFEDFMKLDIRSGEIVEAAKVKGADKLLELTIDVGTETRTIVSGIAQHYTPEDIVGKHVSVLLNLKPRKMRGVLSEGMILMAEDDGKLVFVSPENQVTPGSEIR